MSKMKKQKRNISCPLEQDVANVLIENKIIFLHESQNNNSRLDFYLPDFDVYIEVKQYHSDRINEQLKSQENVIAIQGKKSISFLKTFLSIK